jgi:hypothetical protein
MNCFYVVLEYVIILGGEFSFISAIDVHSAIIKKALVLIYIVNVQVLRTISNLYNNDNIDDKMFVYKASLNIVPIY